MAQTERSAVYRFFRNVWCFIDGTRKVVLNVVFFVILFFVLLAVIRSGNALILQPKTALVIDPQGNVVEQYSGTPLDQALQNATQQLKRETRLRDLVEAIRRARDDDRIIRLVIDPSNMLHIGMASLQELEAAVEDFKTSGKPVIALADNLSQQQYYLAAMADQIWLQPKGLVWIDGFSAYRNYYREGLDKLEVEVNLFRVGEFKSAMEPFVRNDMSAADREATRYWIGGLWQQYLESISRQRGIPLVDLSGAVNHFADRLEAADGDFARFALEIGLVDRLISRPEAVTELANQGAPSGGPEGFRQIDFSDYLLLTHLQPRAHSGKKVAVVVAEGEILQGYQPPGTIGAETLVEQLRAVGEDPGIKAVVLRLNSPGGDSFAAEKVRREVQALREGGKTVVISMGDVAASGAYWIAMAGQEVWASPATVTGSIGVFGIIPTFSKPLEKLGIHTDGVGTAPLAGRLRLDMPLAEDLKRIFQSATEHTYQEFIRIVAQGRNMDTDAVEAVARGRVWSGAQAKDRGLVDRTGTMQEAIDAAARISGLGSDYEVEYSETELSPFETWLLEIAGSSASRLGLAGSARSWMESPLFDGVLGDLRLIAESGDGFSLVSHCLCKSP